MSSLTILTLLLLGIATFGFIALGLITVIVSHIADSRSRRINHMNSHIVELRKHCEAMTQELESMESN
tara:strand:+ start:1224 stop:1427 length:204 start_codon:yes stop_codon:yes gene_type:complete